MTALSTLAPRRDWDPAFAHAHPAFAALAVAGRFAASPDWPDLALWNARLADLGLVAGSGVPLTFVAQPPRGRRRSPAAERYECRVFDRGEVPSRPRNWHDFFNMLCWATFPRAKAALNRRQRAAVARLGLDAVERLPNARSREQDALAMLDEGGCAVLASAPLGEALAKGDVDVVERAVRAGEARVVVVGHAVYEHLASSDGVVRALPVELPVARVPADLAAVTGRADAALAEALDDPRFLAEPPPLVALPMRRSLFESTHDPTS
jgi:uncharacterized protein YbaA (DUF1428 family)